MNKWERFKMPADMRGKSFLDVGCWEGDNCVEATKRHARRTVGVDLCTSETLAKNLAEHPFEFVQMDVFSEKFLGLDTFDVVLCSGVLYHVENVLSLLFRLRKTVSELLVLETATTQIMEDAPVLLFYPANEKDGYPSRWWTPNRACLIAMLETCGFADVRVVWEKEGQEEGLRRVCVHARPVERPSYQKLLPRREQFMSLQGGERIGRR